MSEKLRRIKEEDFAIVSSLFDGRKSIDELKWLFTSTENSGQYNAFVAIDKENNIIGVQGYVEGNYYLNDRKVVGVFPMTWKLVKGYRGMAGLLLVKECYKQGDFSLSLGGSEASLKLYPMLNVKLLSNASVFVRLLNTPSLYNSLKKKSLVKKIGTIGFLLLGKLRQPSRKSLYKHLKLIPYDGSNYNADKSYEGVFRKNITKEYIDWLVKCPTLESIAFNIKLGDSYLGICVLYIQTENKVKKGRIVHLPFLGSEKKIWLSVIDKCSSYFKSMGCHVISGMAHHKMSYLGYKDSGFKKNKVIGIYVKDINDVSEKFDNFKNWHIQYSEGDKAPR